MNRSTVQPPAYFGAVAKDATETWELLRKRPDIKGAWNHLFRQIQNPRFVVSELLQNADDAGATVAEVYLTKEEFTFSHDGKDFNADQFASLCRFGFSNKRNLHTIGFRGIGFKSTFSLGRRVEVWTPTLGVSFSREHFTEPSWIHDGREVATTCIRVPIDNHNAFEEVRENLEQWALSPASLLFFTNIRKLVINGEGIERTESGTRIPRTRLVELTGKSKLSLHILRSDEEPFPKEVLEEISAERDTTDLHLGSCRVEVVLGLKGPQHLFVVLPTGEPLSLPFSINAPFLLKPDRFDIKPPSTSPTNRWLLQRGASLVAEVMHAWLAAESLSDEKRVEAYKLLPSALSTAVTPASRLVYDGLVESLSRREIVINCYSKLTGRGASSVPPQLFEIWSAKQIRELLAPTSQLLSPAVNHVARTALASHGWITEVDPQTALESLATRSAIPQPETWTKLGLFWDFVISHHLRYDYDQSRKRSIPLVPVIGQTELRPATSVVRVSSRTDALSPETIEWLTERTPVLDLRWTDWISKQDERLEANYLGLMKVLQLSEPTPANRLVEQTAASVFARKTVQLDECVQLAQLFASLGANTPKGFEFVTRDLFRRKVDWASVYDPEDALSGLAPANWINEKVLHNAYRDFKRCTREAWDRWIATPASGVRTGFPIKATVANIYSRYSLSNFLASRDASAPKEYFYQRDNFSVRDFVLDDELVNHWTGLAASDPMVWWRALEVILSAPPHGWKDSLVATAHQRGTTYDRQLQCGSITPHWISIFRNKPCLLDTHGKASLPSELYRRTPDTEPLLSIERFVRGELDNETTRPVLRLLGVLETPADYKKIVARLESLRTAQVTPLILNTVGTLYHALDRIVARCSAVDRATVEDLFRKRPLILAADNSWETSGELSIYPGDEDQADVAAIIHPAFQALSMWPRLAVAERPSAAKTLDWLQTLESGSKLDGPTFTRVRRALARDTFRIWEEAGHWLSLDSTWEPVEKFSYRLTLQALARSGSLSPSVKQTVADLRPISAYLCDQTPFRELVDLGRAVEYRVTKYEAAGGDERSPVWLTQLASGFRRIKLQDQETQRRVREAATRLAQTSWRRVTALEVTPYIANTPAGASAAERVVWNGTDLFVFTGSAGRMHRLLVDELGRPFELVDISKAFDSCIGRSVEFIDDYLSEHFSLDAVEPPMPASSDAVEPTSAPDKESPKLDSDGDLPNSSASGEQGADPKESDSGKRDEDSDDEDHDEETAPTKAKSPPDPTIFDRYAASKGFKAAGNGYSHSEGWMILKSKAPFHWELVDMKGESVRRFWTSKDTLDRGVEVDAELWSLTKQEAAKVSWVLAGPDGHPSVLSGKELIARCDDEVIRIFPARYRMRLAQGH